MFSFTRKLLATVMALTMAMGVSATAMAAEGDNVKVQINGVNLDMGGNAPIMKSNRTYVPMRTIFEGLGAEVAFDEATSTVTATRTSEAVQFVVGSKELTINKAGLKNVVTTETPAFIEKGTTYVPVRFIADALGCTVNWDNDAQTALIFDSNKLLAELNGKFTIMDKYMAYSKEFTATPQKISGTLGYDIKLSDPTSPGKELPMKFNGTISGISEADKINMKMVIKMDPASLTTLLAEATKTAEGSEAVTPPTAAEIKELTDILTNMNFDIIADVTGGKMFISMPAFETILGAEKNTWYEFDLNAMFAMSGMGDVTMAQLMDMNKTNGFAESIVSMLKIMPLDTAESSKTLTQLIDIYTKSFSDSAFKKEADGYTSTFKESANGAETVVTMKLTEAADKITGYSMDMTAKVPDLTEMKITASQIGGKLTMSMDFNVSDMMSMIFNADMQYSATTDRALSKPANGAVIVSLNDMMGVTMSATDTKAAAPEAPAPEAPKADAPKADAPKADAPKADAPVVPKTEVPAA